MATPPIREIGYVEIEREQQRQWRDGALAMDWARRYPEIFDEDDLRLVKSQCRYGYHLCEWLAAICLYHLTGYFSLVGKYEFSKHKRKQKVLRQLLPAEMIEVLRDRAHYGHAQAPDLLLYEPGLTDWFLCEVKGPGDRLSTAQREKFEFIAKLTGKPIRLLRIRRAPTRERTRRGESASPPKNS